MQLAFPPGDTSWRNQQPNSIWREFSFCLHQIQRAVEPNLSLKEVINDWNSISIGLAEGKRSRKSQISSFFLNFC